MKNVITIPQTQNQKTVCFIRQTRINGGYYDYVEEVHYVDAVTGNEKLVKITPCHNLATAKYYLAEAARRAKASKY